MIRVARLVGVPAAAAVLTVSGAGAAAADDVPLAGTLNVVAVGVETAIFAAVTDSTPGYVCKSEPAGTPVGQADEYGQALVDDTGFAAFTISGSAADEVTITCGPRYSEWTEDGTAAVMPLS
jgi:hypothetical protein